MTCIRYTLYRQQVQITANNLTQYIVIFGLLCMWYPVEILFLQFPGSKMVSKLFTNERQTFMYFQSNNFFHSNNAICHRQIALLLWKELIKHCFKYVLGYQVTLKITFPQKNCVKTYSVLLELFFIKIMKQLSFVFFPRMNKEMLHISTFNIFWAPCLFT